MEEGSCSTPWKGKKRVWSLRRLANEDEAMSREEKRYLRRSLVIHIPDFPAEDATWMGNIKILDSREELEAPLSTTAHQANRLSVELPVELQQLHAYPASNVSFQAYNMSLKMPAELEVKLLPRSEFWTDLFGNGPPSLADVAFYIFPANQGQRSLETHSRVLDAMEAHDLVMRTNVEGAELFICSSKHLVPSSQEIMTWCWFDRKEFLWGVFLAGAEDEKEDEVAGPPGPDDPMEEVPGPPSPDDFMEDVPGPPSPELA